MIEIILANYGFWFNLALPAIVAVYLYFFNKNFVIQETLMHIGMSVLIVFTSYLLLFSTTTDLIDNQFLNTKVTKLEYYEEWTELETYQESYSCGTTKNPRTCYRTKTRRVYHGPEYYAVNEYNKKSISSKYYRIARNEFPEKFVNISHIDQVSIGDGNKYELKVTKELPTVVPVNYTNYVAAAKYNILHTRNVYDLEKEKFSTYPKVYIGNYGERKLERVISDNRSLSNLYLKYMDETATWLGKQKQCNPILIITERDPEYKEIINQAWNGAKKNDVVFFLGVKDNKVVWSDVIAWSKNTDIYVDAQNQFKGIDIHDWKRVVGNINSIIIQDYQRKPMEEFKYLSENIELDWYWQLLIFLINVVSSGVIIYFFNKNYNRR